jgi:hypothetical protein
MPVFRVADPSNPLRSRLARRARRTGTWTIPAAAVASILLAPAAAHALVSCPGPEPKFPYVDMANDGCFDDGTDTPLTVDDLIAPGGYLDADHGLVVPTNVRLMPAVGDPIDWVAAGIYMRGKIDVQDSYVYFNGPLTRVEIEGSIEITNGYFENGCSSGSCDGELGPNASLIADGNIDADNFVFGDGSRVVSRASTVSAQLSAGVGNGVLLQGQTGLTFSGGTSAAVGDGSSLLAPAGTVDILSGPSGNFEGGDAVTISGASVNIGFFGDFSVGDQFLGEATSSAFYSSVGGSHSIGSGAVLSVATGLTLTGGGPITIGPKASISASGASPATAPGRAENGSFGTCVLSSGAARSIGDGAKIDCASFSMGGGGSDSLGAKVRARIAGDFSMSSSSGATIGEKFKAVIDGNALTSKSLMLGTKSKISVGAAFIIGGGGSNVIGAGSKIVASAFELANGGTLNIGDGARLTALAGDILRESAGDGLTTGVGVRLLAPNGRVALTGGPSQTIGVANQIRTGEMGVVGFGASSSMSFGDGLDIRSGAVSFNNGGSNTFGDGVSVRSDIFFISNGGTNTFGVGSSVDAETSISISNGSGNSLGAGGKWTSGGTISIEGPDALNIGDRFLMMSDGGLRLSSYKTNVDIGERSKFFAPSIEIRSNASATLQVRTRTKMKADALLTLIGGHVVVDAGSKLGVGMGPLGISAVASITVQGAGLSGDGVTVATAGPAIGLNLLDSKLRGTGDMSTLTVTNNSAPCDLTGSRFTKFDTEALTCSPVVGP